MRYRNTYCGMCNNIGTSNLKCEPKNLIQDVQQLLVKAPKKIDLSYENNRLLFNQSSYRAVIEANYELDKRTITFINHLDHQTSTITNEASSAEGGQQLQTGTGRSVKELGSYEHVLYWKGLPASISPAMSAGIRSLVICLSTVFLFKYLLFL